VETVSRFAAAAALAAASAAAAASIEAGAIATTDGGRARVCPVLKLELV
jgi:hypothetical protein